MLFEMDLNRLEFNVGLHNLKSILIFQVISSSWTTDVFYMGEKLLNCHLVARDIYRKSAWTGMKFIHACAYMPEINHQRFTVKCESVISKKLMLAVVFLII